MIWKLLVLLQFSKEVMRKTYRPISVLPCFSKILERIIYNRLFNHLIKNNILYSKQFEIQKGHFMEHVIIQLIDEINNNFENNEFTIGLFIDLSKAFDIIDRWIPLKKLIYYGVNSNNIHWFLIYCTNRKQFLSFNNKNTNFARYYLWSSPRINIWALLFLICANDLCNASNILDPVMFADDTNLFLSKYFNSFFHCK